MLWVRLCAVCGVVAHRCDGVVEVEERGVVGRSLGLSAPKEFRLERIFRPLIESAEVQPGAEGAILESPSTRVPNPIFGCRRLRWFVRKIGRIENETRVKSPLESGVQECTVLY